MKKMDYTIGLEAGRAGRKWTATALTDRAKERTPEPLTFVGRPEALKFLKDSQSEGYRFSGAELVDPEQRLMVELLRRPGHANDGVSTGHTLTGPAKGYQCFGYDLYWLYAA